MRITTRAVVVMTEAKLMRPIDKAIPERALKCAVIVEGEAKRSMRTGGGRRHRPSKRGTPPNVQTGALRSSIQSAKYETAGAIVGPTLFYGGIHEKGGRHHPKRPFMRPALMRSVRQFPKQFEGLV